jgi:hypothetical protein
MSLGNGEQQYSILVTAIVECHSTWTCQGPEERANTLQKINLIAEVVNAVRDGIAKEIESRDTRPHVQDHSQAAVA